ncbi:hypothetical protein [Yersinia frederiksenii]|uniref:Uncharacterized protein n=1 Tax=Yersinia frederiksenii TaxID=29484 RepID=A0AAI8ZPV6_YERFR|nr:hypothetical protein [Yersinia frederiksenii]CFQ95883.1 Uncharacterised protein [Yersinia frederiksenii]
MSQISKHHRELNAEGVGKCSVPMWSGGGPAGFCDEPAYGNPLPREYVTNSFVQRRYLTPGYDGYVPAMACPCHGGPKKP